MPVVVGVSALFHDAAAAVVVDGEVVAALQEERTTRRKHEARLPVDALRWCLDHAQVGSDDIDAIAYYEKPLVAFGRAVRSLAAAGPRAVAGSPAVLGPWFRSKLWVGFEIERAVRATGRRTSAAKVVYAEHHESHAAAAFYPSPFPSAATLTFDGVGEWATSSIGRGAGSRLDLLEELRFPSSIGLLYTAFTVAAGFRANSGEYKLMGLAPYGRPVHAPRILDEIISLHDDGSFDVDLTWFDYVSGRRMTSARFREAFGSDRDPATPITERECDLAASVQRVIEEIVLRMAHHAHRLTGERRAVLAGGVALNGVANARLLRDGPFDEIWVPPAPGDAGSAIGCALWAHHEVLGHERAVPADAERRSAPARPQRSARLGPTIDEGEAAAWLASGHRPFQRIADPAERASRVADLLADGAIVAVAHGALEFGPRALGNRSILADPRSPAVVRALNDRVKRREGFRPFAPAVLAERADEWFEVAQASPYMSFVVPVRGAEPAPLEGSLADRLASVRSPLPAVTHVDGTARLQTVDEDGGWFRDLLLAFERRTGCPVLLNTSFNVRGEPIVATHRDAYRCFATTDLDWLVLGDALLAKHEQPPWRGPSASLVDD